MLRQMDKIAFRRPVEIGDLVRIKSKVVYTKNSSASGGDAKAVVEVFCQVVKPERSNFRDRPCLSYFCIVLQVLSAIPSASHSGFPKGCH